MKIHATVLTFAPIENFKNMSMHISIPNHKVEKAGAYVRAKKYQGVPSSCNILAKFFQPIPNLVRLESKSTANQLAHI
jgi:hypothetical protein